MKIKANVYGNSLTIAHPNNFKINKRLSHMILSIFSIRRSKDAFQVHLMGKPTLLKRLLIKSKAFNASGNLFPIKLTNLDLKNVMISQQGI